MLLNESPQFRADVLSGHFDRFATVETFKEQLFHPGLALSLLVFQNQIAKIVTNVFVTLLFSAPLYEGT